MKCCCISCIVTIVLIIALICVALFVITPEMIGIADEPIMDGQSLRDLGLEKMTLFQIIQELTNLTTPPNEADFVKHSEEDFNSASTKLDLPKDQDGNVDYESILENGLNNTDSVVQLTETEMAAIIDNVIKSATSDAAEEGGEDFSKYVSFSNIELSKGENEGDINAKVTMGIDLGAIIAESGASDEIPAEISSMIPQGKIFLTQEIVVNNHNEGGIVLAETEDLADLLINGKESTLIASLMQTVTDSSDVNNEDVNNIQHQLASAVIDLFDSLGVHSIEFDDNNVGYLNIKPIA